MGSCRCDVSTDRVAPASPHQIIRSVFAPQAKSLCVLCTVLVQQCASRLFLHVSLDINFSSGFGFFSGVHSLKCNVILMLAAVKRSENKNRLRLKSRLLDDKTHNSKQQHGFY